MNKLKKNNLRQQIALRLKQERKAAGYKSARFFAEKIGFSISTYYLHESGRRSMHIEDLLKYSHVLNIDCAKLLFGLDLPSQEQHALSISNSITLQPIEQQDLLILDIKLYKKIIVYAFSLFFREDIDFSRLGIDPEELVSFCHDVYNSTVITTGTDDDKSKMIKLSIESLLKGASIKVAKVQQHQS